MRVVVVVEQEEEEEKEEVVRVEEEEEVEVVEEAGQGRSYGACAPVSPCSRFHPHIAIASMRPLPSLGCVTSYSTHMLCSRGPRSPNDPSNLGATGVTSAAWCSRSRQKARPERREAGTKTARASTCDGRCVRVSAG